MDQTAQTRTRGSYTANLLGNIKSHLAGLQGYDVMALELIQNADDAKAASIVFDITDRGLLVINSGQFTYCGDLRTRPCGFVDSTNYSCDFHRIADVGSGGKLSHGENIGRFGIGFVSTYQVTDHPEIRSAGIKLTLQPEVGEWLIDMFDQPEGTTFFLPWADDPNTQARRALGVSHVSPSHIDQLTEDFQTILRKSLLFLRHVRTAEVRRNGKLLLACDLDRGDGSDLIVSYRPSGKVEQWHILRVDAAEAAARLYSSHPRLESLGRSTKISIGLRIDPEPLEEGVLYAFLPTEQSTGLPIHINADFFPESDRKAVIFAGHQHEQAWNEMLIDAAAAELARDLEGLLTTLGEVQLWQVVGRAYELSKSSNHPACFKQFWAQLKVTGALAHIALAQDGSVQRPDGVFLPRGPLTTQQANTLLEVGGRLVAEDLRPFQTALNQLGAPILTFDRLVNLLEQAMAQQVPGERQVEAKRVDSFYLPLWSMVNDLLPDAANQTPGTNPAIQRLLAIPFMVTEDLYAVAISQSFVVPASLDAGRVVSLLPRLAIAARVILGFPKIARLIRQLELGAVVSHISSICATEPVEDVIGVEQQDLRDLYAMFSDLDRQATVEKAVYQALRNLPIWLSSRGLIKATHALLPGNFTDPTGQSDLLETSVLNPSSRDFVSSKLGVQTQTIEAFVQNVVPRFFSDEGPLDAQKYTRLISELASYPTLMNDEGIRRQLGALPIVPTQDGRWSRPTATYRRNDELVKVLGDSAHLWLDASRLPDARSVQVFIDSLGIRRSPLAQHLVDRMLYIAEKSLPTEDAKRASGEAFYVLCDHFEEWGDKPFVQGAINDLRKAACFPAIDDEEAWHSSNVLYAPYRAEAFSSQANILDFRNMSRINRELLKKLHVALEPETTLVINHLRHCVTSKTPAPFTTYQILNERSKDESALISSLSGDPFIYIESQKAFVRSNQLFWAPQQLGRFAFTIPGNFEAFKPLFDAIGVKNAPEGRDYIDILLDIVGEHFEKSKAVHGSDRSVYESCLTGASALDERGEISASDFQRLQKAPTILNLNGQPTHPDEVLLQDSEWHAGFFEGELDPALCKPAPELWPFIEKVGVRRLSKSAKVSLEFVDGPMSDELEIAEKLVDRADIFARLLHDKATAVKKKVQWAVSKMTAVSYEVVRIQASVGVGGDLAIASPKTSHAFFDIDKRQLFLARPVGDRSWPHILNAVFHQLMPEESGSEISKLTLSVRPMMNMLVDEAHCELTDAGIPHLEADSGGGQAVDLTSSALDDLGSSVDSGFEPESDAGFALPEVSTGVPTGSEPTHHHRDGSRQNDEVTKDVNGATLSNPGQHNVGAWDAEEMPARSREQPTWNGDGNVSPRGEAPARTPRPKHKEQWDRRLLTYVRKMQEQSGDGDQLEESSEHNLAVEIVARAAVSAFEKERGRVAEQMAQTHPGYDIISRNPLTGEERFIEVKGVNGEWNQTGVGLSRLQFSNAQNYGDRYWLYVVEFVSDPEHTCVHAIRSPATQVTSFMFDGNWRDAVAEERVNPLLVYIAGTRVRHKMYGLGEVVEVIKALDTMRVVKIRYDDGQVRPTTLNVMDLPKIVSDDDSNHS
ncbi:hypothetical protein LPB72_07195 [Hydrogenophaga crassostreae]|uniref:Uncharacterized protein n=1 Tax=Hydrogenophaga crassostreae TaxID=1763535 RepID=A0A162P9W4_9BURK|nr:DUF3883 domain-containing protein [Hydrogenophaga crassostreae]AOW15537.1 hypothetical protein LPB072_10180 [Hydrogenophaga crassostreae]OAD42796.1 hypothetical protein LPB72_07195 [Hydrogenophaga crassostreae]